MSAINISDINCTMNTLQEAMTDLAHDLAAMQNKMSELKTKQHELIEADCERWWRDKLEAKKQQDVMKESYKVMEPCTCYWNPSIMIDDEPLYLGVFSNQWDSICAYMSARNKFLGEWS